ncbi:MAG TPA: tetratricopeptide repeat protein, partial [Bacteroidia bacterium]|nr:tetratricopeptide repeat protein [Bacteroidia bacterium]
TFQGVTQLQWTNWDDDRYVYENKLVAEADYSAIFSTPVAGNYNPLPIATFALEWQVAGDNPWLYHFDNLWLHLVCTALVFWLLGLLGLQPLWAGFAALMFGIHPLHVESVAWITERKDVLYGLFYLGSLIAYLRFQRSGDRAAYVLCLLLFALALLSKIQAVSLPLAMIALDAYQGRKWTIKAGLQKLPFFLGAATMGIVGMALLQDIHSLNAETQFGWSERLVLGLNAFFIYLVKAVIPYETCIVYPYPAAVGIQHVLGAVAAMGMVLAAILLRKKAPSLFFGMAFFAVSVVFVLQILGAGHAYQADRFTYISYIGLFFAMAMGAQRLAASNRSRTLVLAGLGVVMVGFYGIRSREYIPKWENSFTIWSDMIEKYPNRFALAYINRGDHLRLHQQKDRGMADFSTAISLNPNFYMGYLNRADLCFELGEDARAIADYTQALRLLGPFGEDAEHNLIIVQALGNRGSLHARNGRFQEALADLNPALAQLPDDLNLLNSRALTWLDLGMFPEAIADLSAILELQPRSVNARINRGVAYMNIGKLDDALRDFDMALQDDPQNQSARMNRDMILSASGR